MANTEITGLALLDNRLIVFTPDGTYGTKLEKLLPTGCVTHVGTVDKDLLWFEEPNG